MADIIQLPASTIKIAQATMNLAQAANSYDLLTASGPLVILQASLYCTVVGAVFTSVTIQTSTTVPFVIMNATEGARANFVANSNMAITWTQVQKAYLPSSERIRMTIAGSTGTGTALLTVVYLPLTSAGLLA